ncbi:MAG: MFS transporter [Candidatus Portnoybacteria bacterium]|nr:MFS transporter [Candidatus Portnoybacteria bacterium]
MNLPKKKIYFDGKVSHGFVSLYTGKTIVMIAAGLLGLFLPIFIYNLFGQNFQYTVFYFAIGYLFYAVAVTLGAKFLNKFGFRRSLRISIFLGAAYYTVFYFIKEDNLIYLIPLTIIILLFYNLSYWLPYHVNFAKFTSRRNRSRQVAAISATREIMGISLPILAGFIIIQFGFEVLFVMAIILYLTSGISYITIPQTYEKFSWTYLGTWQKFFSKEYRKTAVAFIAVGAESVTTIVIWPIFIFQLLQGNYLKVGAISTFIIATTVILNLTLGRALDKKLKKEKVLKFGSIFYSFGWLIKIFIATAFQIFVVGVYHNLMSIFTKMPFETLAYETAADQGHYVDEFTVLREIAINIGKTSILILAFFGSMFLAIQWVFVLAAIAAIAFNLLGKKLIL